MYIYLTKTIVSNYKANRPWDLIPELKTKQYVLHQNIQNNTKLVVGPTYSPIVAQAALGVVRDFSCTCIYIVGKTYYVCNFLPD